MAVSDLVYIDSAGFHLSDYPTFLDYIQTTFKNIYGQDIYIDPDSQDGQWLATLAQMAYDTAAVSSSVYNSFSPVTGQGVGLSRNVKINGLSRQAATFSTVDLTCVGTAGTVLNQAIAIDTLNQKWVIPDGTTIPGGGSITVTATSQVAGAISAAAGTVNKIYTPTLGWQSVTNSLDAVAGVAVETDSELRIRQAQSTADPSLTVFEGMLGAVKNVSGVTMADGYENDTETTDGNGLPPHATEIVVVGGSSSDIAQAILNHKTPGGVTSGSSSATVNDSKGMPYLIKFTRATVATISVKITLSSKTGWTTDTEALIASAVAAVINDVGIGNDVLLTRLFSPAYLIGTAQSSTFDIATIELKKNAGSFAATNVSILYNEYAYSDPAADFTFVVT